MEINRKEMTLMRLQGKLNYFKEYLAWHVNWHEKARLNEIVQNNKGLREDNEVKLSTFKEIQDTFERSFADYEDNQ